ncbi:MAG: hypothetical protein P8M78_12150 [Myxococcota bacterium]|nr:hypothetical protein [Myxococcota bacterium]
MSNTTAIHRALFIFMVLFVFLAGCQKDDDAPKTLSTTLTATPNPVPAGANLGKTTISWSIAGDDQGRISVSHDGNEEVLFSEVSTPGTKEADWIEQGSTYVFRLYKDSDRKNPLKTLTVTRLNTRVIIDGEETGTISARPNPVPAGTGPGVTTIRWVLSEGEKGQIYVSTKDGEEKLFVEVSTSGEQQVDWIDQQDFEFRLYAGDSRETVLGSVLVTRNGPSTPQQNVSSTPGEQTESPKSPH